MRQVTGLGPPCQEGWGLVVRDGHGDLIGTLKTWNRCSQALLIFIFKQSMFVISTFILGFIHFFNLVTVILNAVLFYKPYSLNIYCVTLPTSITDCILHFMLYSNVLNPFSIA